MNNADDDDLMSVVYKILEKIKTNDREGEN